MATDYQGAGSLAQFKKESAWGTAVTPTIAVPIISSTLKKMTATAPSPVLYTGDSGMPRRHHQLRTEAGGTVVMPFSYGGIGYILEAIFGSVTGSGPFVYTLGGQNALPSLTWEDVLGDSGNARTYEGMMIARATISWSAGDTGGRISLDLIGETSGAPGAKTSLTVDTSTVVMPYDAGTLAWNSGTHTLNSIEIVVENQIARRLKMGSLLTKKPQPTAQRRVTCKIAMDVDDAFEAAQNADTQDDAVITLTDGSRSVAIQVCNAYLETVESPRTSHGIVEMNVGMVAEDDGTEAGLILTVTNADLTNYYD